jgi:excisionase family DNA binding protein
MLSAGPNDSTISRQRQTTPAEMTEHTRIEVVTLADVLPPQDVDRKMRKREAAAFVGLGVRTIEGLLDEIPHFRVGAKVLFRRSELIAWMDRHRERVTGDDLDRIAEAAVKAVLGEKELTVRRSS